jgi:LysR family hydrogen peroxide-inducible transcriptional activator
MNFKQVRYFLTICAERNFTRAARRCEVQQPSLTAAIQRLEREIGGELFVRSSPVELSALGVALYPLFVRMHDAAEGARQIAAEHAPPASTSPVVNAPARY